ncbi:MAG TPA: hypothetical protein VF509_16325 [Sphingobium sp.]
MFAIEDEIHAEQIGEFNSAAEAMDEFQRLARLPWSEAPNVCPCTSWQTCGRTYHLIEYDTSSTPWREMSNIPVLEVSATRTSWLSIDEARASSLGRS